MRTFPATGGHLPNQWSRKTADAPLQRHLARTASLPWCWLPDEGTGRRLPSGFFPGAIPQGPSGAVKGLAWLRDRSEKATAVRILRDNLQVEGDGNLFSDLCDSALSREAGGFDLGGTVDAEGLRRVVDLRKGVLSQGDPKTVLRKRPAVIRNWGRYPAGFAGPGSRSVSREGFRVHRQRVADSLSPPAAPSSWNLP